MANIKDLFAIYQNQKVLPSSSLGALDNTIESADFVRSRLKLRDEFEPLVDGNGNQVMENAAQVMGMTKVVFAYEHMEGSSRKKEKLGYM